MAKDMWRTHAHVYPIHVPVVLHGYSIAIVYAQQGQSTDALELYHKSLIIKQQQLGDDHPVVADTNFKYTQVLFPFPC